MQMTCSEEGWIPDFPSPCLGKPIMLQLDPLQPDCRFCRSHLL